MSDENVFYYHGAKVCDKTITKVVIASGVTKINAGAFEGCKKLQSVEFEEPHQVTEIGILAFCWCRALNRIQLPESLKKIGREAFNRCRTLRRIVIPGKVNSIGASAFVGSGIEEIVISDGFESISFNSFVGCPRLHTVRLPASLKEIQYGAFSRCDNLENVIVPDDGLPLLKWLDLVGSYESRGWEAMCKLARNAQNVTRLSLSFVRVEGRQLDDGDIPLVIELVSSCPHLESLNILHNKFSEQAIRTLDSEGILGRLRHVDLRCNHGTGNMLLSANEFLNLLRKNPRLAILTDHEWVNHKDERLIHHYLDMNRYGCCGGVSIRNVSTWPRLIDRLGRIDGKLKTSSTNVLYHLLHEQNNDLCLHYQQNRTKWHPDWEKRIDSLKAVIGIAVTAILSPLHKK